MIHIERYIAYLIAARQRKNTCLFVCFCNRDSYPHFSMYINRTQKRRDRKKRRTLLIYTLSQVLVCGLGGNVDS